MPLTETEKADLNATFDAVFLRANTAQVAYISSSPRYAQLLQGPGNRNPAYQQTTFAPADVPDEMYLDQYVGPRGIGWVLHYAPVVRGDRYIRAQAFGPESHFTHDWVMEVEVR